MPSKKEHCEMEYDLSFYCNALYEDEVFIVVVFLQGNIIDRKMLENVELDKGTHLLNFLFGK